MPTVCALQHIAIETPGRIADALQTAGATLQTVHACRGDPVPRDARRFAGLVIMGGPQGVYEQDQYPFLRDELHLIESALKLEKPVLGVCLGSQLLAAALGARVYPGPRKEIGWFPVTFNEAAGKDPLLRGMTSPLTVLHWHGDVFDLPAGATAVAASDLTAVQAYRYGDRAYGFLFHTEVIDRHVAEWVTQFAEQLHQAGADARAILAGAKKHLPALHQAGGVVFARWAALIGQTR